MNEPVARRAVVTTVFVVAFVLWEVGVRAFHVPNAILPAPSQALMELFGGLPYYLTQSSYTLIETLAGFFVATVVGLLLAVCVVYSRILEDTIFSVLVSLNSVPKVALAPLFIIWLGTGLAPKIATSVLLSIFVIVIDTVLALRSVDQELLDLARALRASEADVLLKIRFPAALPAIFGAMKIAISLSLVGAIIGEFVASQHGLGYVVLTAEGQFDTARMFAAIFVLGIIGTLLFYCIDFAERLFVPWHISVRRRT